MWMCSLRSKPALGKLNRAGGKYEDYRFFCPSVHFYYLADDSLQFLLADYIRSPQPMLLLY